VALDFFFLFFFLATSYLGNSKQYQGSPHLQKAGKLDFSLREQEWFGKGNGKHFLFPQTAKNHSHRRIDWSGLF
jgi:hypothetical protein